MKNDQNNTSRQKSTQNSKEKLPRLHCNFSPKKEKAELELSVQSMARIYEKRYGLSSELTLRQVNEITYAETELAMCENCLGAPCQKIRHEYEMPMIESWDLQGSIPLVPCRLKPLKAKGNMPLKYADKTFADYEITDDNERAIRLAKWFITKKPAKSLYLYGGAGTGKTFLATLIAKEFCNVIFGDVPTLLGKIKQTFNGNGDSQEIISRYCNCDLLILDDLGAGQVTEWSADIIYQIINNRYNALKPIVITSNFDIEGLQERLKIDSYSATRITSRLSEMCLQGFLGTKDRRR